MSISVNDSIITIDLQKIYDFLEMLKTEIECANAICKKVDDWSYWLPRNINEIKDELWTKRKHIDEFMDDISTVITARKNIYDGYCEYLASKQEESSSIKY